MSKIIVVQNQHRHQRVLNQSVFIDGEEPHLHLITLIGKDVNTIFVMMMSNTTQITGLMIHIIVGLFGDRALRRTLGHAPGRLQDITRKERVWTVMDNVTTDRVTSKSINS